MGMGGRESEVAVLCWQWKSAGQRCCQGLLVGKVVGAWS